MKAFFFFKYYEAYKQYDLKDLKINMINNDKTRDFETAKKERDMYIHRMK